MKAFQTYFMDVLKNHYADFKGRATRKQYWLYVLFMFVLVFAIGLVGGITAAATGDTSKLPGLLVGGIFFLLWLVLLIPSLAIQVRRLHDTNRSGWWILLGIIPFVNYIGGIVLLVFYCLPSVNENNRF